MRVAIFTNQYPSRISTFFERDVASLLNEGIERDIFTLYPEDHSLWQYSCPLYYSVQSGRIHLFDAGPHLGLRSSWSLKSGQILNRLLNAWSTLRSNRHEGVGTIARYLWLLPNSWHWAFKQISEYDHILAYWGNYVAVAAIEFRRYQRRRIPLTIIFHAEIDLYLHREALPAKLREADHIGVVCNYNKQFIATTCPHTYAETQNKIFVHYSGLDLNEYTFRAGPRFQNHLLSVGRFVRTKGFDILIDAVALLCRKGIACSAVIVGDGPERSALSQRIQRLGLEKVIQLDQWHTPEEVRRRMWSCTALVQASRGIGDATPTVIKEAMATGAPVIASAVAGIPELLNFGQCGALVPEESPSALADAIATFLSDSRLREEVATKARAHAEKLFDQHQNGRELACRLRTHNQKPT